MILSVRKTIQKIRKGMITILCILFCCSLFTTKVNAAFGTEWQSWNPITSTNPAGVNIRGAGCLLTAISKMLADHEAVPAGFNPDTLALWAYQNGYIERSAYLNRWSLITDYAAMYGVTIQQEAVDSHITGSRVNEIVLNNAMQGKYTILSMNGGTHYVYADNEASLANGRAYTYDITSTPLNLNGSNYMARTYVIPHSAINLYPDIRQNQIGDTNATIFGRVDKDKRSEVQEMGIKFWNRASGEDQAVLKIEPTVSTYKGYQHSEVIYDTLKDFGITLTPNTSYSYRVYFKVDGNGYWSDVTEFVTSSETGNGIPDGAETMYRMYNPNSGEHFYTASGGERIHLFNVGWNYEGYGWYAPKSGTEVYRLYNPNDGDHHYTVSALERDNLISVGWNYEGVGWYSNDNQTVPLYREYNPNATTGTHNYTRNEAEHNGLIRIGWNDEGIAWYGM